jgi:hypothetical protein
MIQIALIVLLSTLVQLVLPWWSLAVIAFAVCAWRSDSGGQAFIIGFLSIALVWMTYALIIHLHTKGIFTSRVGALLFKSSSVALPLVVTVILGGLVGGLAGLTGFFVRRSINPVAHTPKNA